MVVFEVVAILVCANISDNKEINFWFLLLLCFVLYLIKYMTQCGVVDRLTDYITEESWVQVHAQSWKFTAGLEGQWQ